MIHMFILFGFCLVSQNTFAKKSLIVAFSELPPLKIIKDGKFQGPYAQIIREISKTLNIPIKFIECPLNRCLFYLKMGQADLIIGIKKDPMRSKYIQYIETPIRITEDKVFYLREGEKNKVRKYEDLYNIGIIGTKSDAKYFTVFDNDEALIKYPVPYTKQNFYMLLHGNIDALIVARDQGEYITSELNLNNKVEVSDYFYKDYRHSYIGIAKTSVYLNKVNEIDNVLNQMSQSGRLKSILHQYTLKKQRVRTH